MDCPDYITVEPERKPGQHLQREERGAIQRLRRLGYSNRAIARELNCSPTTVGTSWVGAHRPARATKAEYQAIPQSEDRRCTGQTEADAISPIRWIAALLSSTGSCSGSESIAGLWMPAWVMQGFTCYSRKMR